MEGTALSVPHLQIFRRSSIRHGNRPRRAIETHIRVKVG
jgi:hypothetical protein